MTTHDPKTVLCKDCKHYDRPRGQTAQWCYHPTVRSVIDGGGKNVIFVRYLECKGELWEAKPPAPPKPPPMGFWKRQLYAFLKACPFIY